MADPESQKLAETLPPWCASISPHLPPGWDFICSCNNRCKASDEDYAMMKAVAEALSALRAELEALQSEITEAAYLAWPDAEDIGYDAKHIIAEIAAERDAARAALAKDADHHG